MAPITRHAATVAVEDFNRPDLRSETAPNDSDYMSETSLDQEDDYGEEGPATGSQAEDMLATLPFAPGQHEDTRYPLKAMADRGVRQVESFAEQLDRLNSLSSATPKETQENIIKLVEEYTALATGALQRLRREHSPKYRQQAMARLQKRIQSLSQASGGQSSGFSISGGGLQRSVLGQRTTVHDLIHWEQEFRTWALLLDMIQLKSPDLSKTDAKRSHSADSSPIHHLSSERKIWDRFLIQDDLARERHTVLKWLKSNARDSPDDLETIVEQLEKQADRGPGLWADGWLTTKEAIKAQKRLRSWPRPLDPKSPGIATSLLNADKTERLVTHLDPDAPSRQELVLEKQDDFLERAIWLGCWEMLRRGVGWNEIREWCRERVEGWRAVSMRGAVAAWDAAIDGSDGEGDSDGVGRDGSDSEDGPPPTSQISGNRSRALWRRMCFQLARNGGSNDYERAVYGILSGDVESAEKVCSSWEDFVFVRYNSLLLHQFDLYLQKNYPDRLPTAMARKFGVFDSIQFHGEPESASRRLVEFLKTQEMTRTEATQPIKLIQGALIGKAFVDFAQHQGIALARAANTDAPSKILPLPEDLSNDDGNLATIPHDDYDALRLITHILIVFLDLGADIGHGPRRSAIENVIVAYIDFLRLAGKIRMIPVYASRLSSQRQITTLGRVLPDVIDHYTRKDLIRLMNDHKIDVYNVVEMQMAYVLEDTDPVEQRVSKAPTILQPARAGKPDIREIQDSFIGDEKDLQNEDDLIIRSFEWYLLVEGHWRETFSVGARLYEHFLLTGKILAARELYRRVPCSEVSLAKTGPILGRKVDISRFDADSDDEDDDLTSSRMTRSSTHHQPQARTRRESSERNKLKRQILVQEARIFTQLEQLVEAFVTIEQWASIVKAEKVEKDGKLSNPQRTRLQKALDNVLAAVDPLLEDWLVDLPKAEFQSLTSIRNTYLPEVLLAYNSVLYSAGHALHRDILLQSMHLSTLIAATDSDLLEPFIATGRLQELVTQFAASSREILLGVEEKKGAKRGGRKRGELGETLAIWNVRA
ncbi:MAG: Nucleoporin nup84 [Piccolia ochrophora]|nr:MAG: Nucleoporin nup84 [Piccolia ochrophora]